MYKSVTVNGEAGVKATCLLHSVATAGVPMVTFEIEYPRIILAEINTHRMLAKSSASSRAIPFEKMTKQLIGRPVRFGKANKGMQDTGEQHDGKVIISAYEIGDNPSDSVVFATSFEVNGQEAWEFAKESAVEISKAFYEAGFAKQVYNRLTEPFQMIKTVISGTEWANFFWLRYHESADPTFAELARCMYEALMASTPQQLMPGEWHLPYIITNRNEYGDIEYWLDESTQLSEEDALIASAARCAAVSFRNIDYGLEKCRQVFERQLVGGDRKHGSALEHQAKAMDKFSYEHEYEVNIAQYTDTWEGGITHMDKNYQLWSGPYRDWIQHRKLIPGECYNGSLEYVRQSS